MYQQGQMNTLPQAFEKKLRRLEKNRESARECRRRKKEHVVELQKQVAHLEAENLKLKLQLKVGEESQAQERQEKGRITKKLDDMVRFVVLLLCGGRDFFCHVSVGWWGAQGFASKHSPSFFVRKPATTTTHHAPRSDSLFLLFSSSLSLGEDGCERVRHLANDRHAQGAVFRLWQ